ncbi:MAG: peptidoglycan-binding protein [Polyangiaceae bacterium]|nr:peptidoglycan-binding protein [Polyangiaceae bacterium]
MPSTQTARLGDCVGSLAKQNGFADYKKIYDDPANATLKTNRKNPNVLAEGDSVTVPDRELKEVDADAGKSHKFKVKVLETLLRIVVQDDAAAAIADKKYKLTVGTATFEGKTPADGKIEHPIEGDAKTGTLELWLKEGDGIEGFKFDLELGSLEHESKDRACQARLINLGFDTGSTSGTLDDATKDAIRGFQKKNSITVNGNLDNATRDKLRTLHEGA